MGQGCCGKSINTVDEITMPPEQFFPQQEVVIILKLLASSNSNG